MTESDKFKRYIEIVAEMAHDGCVLLSYEDKEILKECSEKMARK